VRPGSGSSLVRRATLGSDQRPGHAEQKPRSCGKRDRRDIYANNNIIVIIVIICTAIVKG
jgi:hypothetical protein